MEITRKLVISSTLWAVFAQGSVMLINLLVLPLFIKNLGADLYGIWILSGLVLGYAGVFDFGFSQGLQKYVAEARVKKDDQELSEVVVTGLSILTAIGVILGGVIYFGAPSIVAFFNIESGRVEIARQLIQISALFCVIMWPLRIVDVVLNASMRIKELSLLNAVKLILQSVIMLILILCSFEIIQMKWIVSFSVFIVGLYGIVLLKKYVPEVCWHAGNFRFKQILRMQRFSMGMFYASLLGVLAVQIDSLVIGKLLTMSAITTYAIAAKPYQMIQGLMMLAGRAIQPAAYNLRAAKDHVRLEKLVSEGVRVRSISSIPVCIIAFLCMPQFIVLWVGPDYAWAVPWARWFVLVPIFSCLGVAGQVCSTSSSGIVLANIIGSFRTVLNVVISLYLISRWGIGGPILGTIISFALLGSLGMCYVYCRFMKINSRRAYVYFFKTVLVSVIGGAVSYFLFMAFIEVSLWNLLIYVFLAGLVQVLFVSGLLITSEERSRIIGLVCKLPLVIRAKVV